MIEEIRERLPLYEATITDDLHYQMVEDISSLLILFDAQKIAEEQKKLIIEIGNPFNYISKGCIEYLERKYGISINKTDLDNFLNREI